MVLIRSLTICVFATLLLSAAVPTFAQNRAIGLQTPSGNIHCQFFSYDHQSSFRCDIGQIATRPPRPTDCDLDWGSAFEMPVRGNKTQRLCHGDTVMDKSLPVLSYGEIWQHGGFTCTSEQNSLTCFNADRHGFSLSKAKQDIF
ncbi:MAG: DUF6636 domain-containing protein [Xanthobacteraceae bacterium]